MAYLGEGTPKLGFGLMRLSKLESGAIDVEQVKQMVDLFLDSGFTYFDTARAYGDSEEATRKALVERHPRDSYTLATKNAPWLGAANEQEAKAFFETSLKNTGAGYFDYYLLHNLGGNRTHVFDDFHMWDWVFEQKAKGLIKHVGCSIHDKADFVDKILTEHPELEFVQLQINYADWDDPVVEARKCYEAARKHGKPVVIMEPVKGGYLSALPESVERVLKAAEPDASPASWAIRFAASLPGTITVLSGMSSLAQVQDNVSFMKDFKPLTDAEQQVIAQAQQALLAIDRVPCTDCKYCVSGCPEQIPIPDAIAAINDYNRYGNLERAKGSYNFATAGKGVSSACVQCGTCEDACPQSIDIINQMARAAELFE